MSEDHFHVHGPHDHALEHEAQHAPGGMAGQLAVLAAVLATVAAIFSYMGGATQANAVLYKNDAAIKKTEAANQWNYYQAKNNRQSLAELAVALAPEAKRASYEAQAQRYQAEKAAIQQAAEKLEAESKEWNERSAEQMHEHHRWAEATTVLQVAIALAAIALLSKRRWLQWGTMGLGCVGVSLGALAWFHL